MPRPVKPTNDPRRIEAVRATQLLDTEAEPAFDQYTLLARKLTKAPIAFVSLVMPDYQFFKSAHGFDEPVASERCTPLAYSLCRHVVDGARPLVLGDARNDPDFRQHSAVTELGLQSYLGVPILDESGLVLGSMCVADRRPHPWSDEDVETVRTLGEAVRSEILLRQANRERADAETEARADHELLSRLLQTSVAAVVVLDPAGQIVFCNQSAERILGIKRSEIEGRNFDAPEWRATAMDGGPWTDDDQPFTRVLRSRQPVFDIQHAIEWPDGTRRYLSVNGAPILDADGVVERLVFLVNDITDHHLAREQLRRAAEQFNLAFRRSPHPALLCERETGRIVEASDGFCRSLGLERDTCVGRSVTDHDIQFPASIAQSLFTPADVPLPDEDLDLALKASDGRLRLLKLRPLPLQVGQLPLVLLAGSDLTRQRESEHQRLALEAQLREAQKVEVVGRFASGIAHDFNNILTSILGNAELMVHTLPEPHEARESAELIKRSARRAAEQIKQILALSRRERAERKPIDLNAAVEETLDLFTNRLPAGVDLTHDSDSTTPPVLANVAQLQQIVLNLLTNALHSLHGNGTIRVRTQAADGIGSGAIVEVSDNGSGIDPVHLPLIFEPFFTTRAEGKGTGIGLALARTIARGLGGEITVESKLGEGSTFRLQLPPVPHGSSSDPVHQAAATLDSTPPVARKLKLLLVDDDPEVLLTGRLMLEQLGHTVDATALAPAALESVRASPDRFDVLITDNLMPVMNGIELIAELRRAGCTLPAIIVSGYAAISDNLDELEALQAQFVPKPFSIPELQTALNRAVPSPA